VLKLENVDVYHLVDLIQLDDLDDLRRWNSIWHVARRNSTFHPEALATVTHLRRVRRAAWRCWSTIGTAVPWRKRSHRNRIGQHLHIYQKSTNIIRHTYKWNVKIPKTKHQPVPKRGSETTASVENTFNIPSITLSHFPTLFTGHSRHSCVDFVQQHFAKEWQTKRHQWHMNQGTWRNQLPLQGRRKYADRICLSKESKNWWMTDFCISQLAMGRTREAGEDCCSL